MPRGQKHLTAACPRCSNGGLDAGACAELLGWYLGDGHISLSRRGVYSLHIYNDLNNPVLNAHISDLMRGVKPHSRPHTRVVPGCLVTTVGWKHWPCLFPQHGRGRKHERRIFLERWQDEIVTEHPWVFLRGLFHSDGSRVANWATRPVAGEMKRYEYPRWMFVNSSDDIIELCSSSLDRVGVAWRRPRVNCVAVSTRAGVLLLDEHVGLKRGPSTGVRS